MSEQQPTYNVSCDSIESLSAFKNLPCSNSFDEWEPPEPEQVKALIDLSGMGRKQWAALLGVTYSEKHGSTTIRKWCMKKTAKDYRQVPFATWRLMLIYTGVANPEKDLLTTMNNLKKIAK